MNGLEVSLKKHIKEGRMDSVLRDITEKYGEYSQKNPKELIGIFVTKKAYQFAIKEAKKMGLDVSEYPTELNHLDYLLDPTELNHLDYLLN